MKYASSTFRQSHMAHIVHIGNLDWSITQEEAIESLKAAANGLNIVSITVSSISKKRTRDEDKLHAGFALITVDSKETMDRCVGALSGVIIGSKAISVSISRKAGQIELNKTISLSIANDNLQPGKIQQQQHSRNKLKNRKQRFEDEIQSLLTHVEAKATGSVFDIAVPLLQAVPPSQAPPVDWTSIPFSVDPMGEGGLKAQRGIRKRQQIETFFHTIYAMLAANAAAKNIMIGDGTVEVKMLQLTTASNNSSNLSGQMNEKQQDNNQDSKEEPFLATIMSKSSYHQSLQQHEDCNSSEGVSSPLATATISPEKLRIVDFGCGSGNLTLALGYLLERAVPGRYEVVGVDMKHESIARLVKRVHNVGLEGVISGSVGRIEEYKGPLGVAVSLHACGVATDLTIGHAVLSRAPFIVSPCCIGKLKFGAGGAASQMCPSQESTVWEDISTSLEQVTSSLSAQNTNAISNSSLAINKNTSDLLPQNNTESNSSNKQNNKPTDIVKWVEGVYGASDVAAFVSARGLPRSNWMRNLISKDSFAKVIRRADSDHSGGNGSHISQTKKHSNSSNNGDQNTADGRSDYEEDDNSSTSPLLPPTKRSRQITKNDNPFPDQPPSGFENSDCCAEHDKSDRNEGHNTTVGRNAAKCKTLVELDRALFAAESGGYRVALMKLIGHENFAKNDLIIGVPPGWPSRPEWIRHKAWADQKLASHGGAGVDSKDEDIIV